ncbi:riboflavin synthase [Ferrovibrio sp.]|jgi:riboflavin synthase|uniref:riboflavin synthase n=1 Tax=Ferrovibrio sp. TaxID=1917215 RepID=UPI0035AFEABA
MFTGIVTDIGTVTAREARGDTRFRIRTAYDTASIAIGASIACSGVCLTVVQKGDDWFAVDVSAETLSRTGLGNWQEGSRINLERSLRVGDELGGHIVSGHVDGVGDVSMVRPDGDSLRIEVKAPDALAPFIAEKGSITVDGVSLTVNSVERATFGINLIPHTQQVTTLGKLKAGDRVNLEIDTLARYVARLQQWSKPA